MRVLLILVLVIGLSGTGYAEKNHSHMMGDKDMKMMMSNDKVSIYSLSDMPMYGKATEFILDAYQFDFYPKEIKVKKGDRVRIFATSRDVKHGVYIGEFNINVPVKKGEVKIIEFIADKAGTFDILCSVYCGKGHRVMKAKLIVER
ncbi:MAG: cupredoxin domain-containing protein [Candidatus Saganbacteria bacterium]|nr:cupredoxin domain-containing protein [Candidatus Saganbacteria bacterium]